MTHLAEARIGKDYRGSILWSSLFACTNSSIFFKGVRHYPVKGSASVPQE